MIISLIGPKATGKSKIGEKLANLLNFEFVDFDEYLNTLFKLGKYNNKKYSEGFFGRVSELDNKGKDGWAEVSMICQKEIINFLNKNEQSNIILEIGGNFVGDPPRTAEWKITDSKLNKLIRKKSTVIFLFPSKDYTLSAKLLAKREKLRPWKQKYSLNKLKSDFLEDFEKVLPNQKKLAHYRFYIGNKTVSEASKYIFKKLKPSILK